MVTVYMISGKAKHGKDSIYEVGREFIGWKKAAFADKLKEITMDLYNLTEEQIKGNSKDKQDSRYINYYDPKTVLVDIESPIKNLPKNIKIQKAAVYIDNEKYTKFLSPRRILQIIGKQHRDIYPAVWAEYLFNKTIPTLVKGGAKDIIITDTRFLNELEAGEKWRESSEQNRIIKIRIIRSNIDNIKEEDDISETELDSYSNWDFIINNDKSLVELKEKVKVLYNTFKEKPTTTIII